MIFYLCLMKKSIFCIGSALIDELYFCHENVIPETSNPATLQKNVGGVISNISQHLALFDYDINYLTVIGNDIEGNWIEDEFIKKGKYGEALEYYYQALERNPSLPSALNNISVIYHYRGEQALESSQTEISKLLFDKAADYWREAIRLAPDTYIEAQNWLKMTGRF